MLTPRNIAATVEEASSKLVPDTAWTLDCWRDEEKQDLNHTDCDAANDALDAQCRDGAPLANGRSFYSISGCVVDYFCNFHSWFTIDDAICTKDDRKQTSGLITGHCGWYAPGSASRTVVRNPSGGIPSQFYRVSYGYEDYCSGGRNFCGMCPI